MVKFNHVYEGFDYYIGKECAIVKCTSQDFNTGDTLSVLMNKYFDLQRICNQSYKVYKLLDERLIPQALPVGNIYNLITRLNRTHRPNIDTFKLSLEKLKCKIDDTGVTQIILYEFDPDIVIIALDRVKEVIESVFSADKREYDIIICNKPLEEWKFN